MANLCLGELAKLFYPVSCPVVFSPIPSRGLVEDEFLDLRFEQGLKKIVIFFQLQKVSFLIRVLSKVGSLFGEVPGSGGCCSGSALCWRGLARGFLSPGICDLPAADVSEPLRVVSGCPLLSLLDLPWAALCLGGG